MKISDVPAEFYFCVWNDAADLPLTESHTASVTRAQNILWNKMIFKMLKLLKQEV